MSIKTPRCLMAILVTLLSTAMLWAQADTGRDVYGWLRYDEAVADVGVCKFLTTDAENIDVVYPNSEGLTACAGAFANGYYYVYLCTPGEYDGDYDKPHSLCRINLKDGKTEQVADWRGMPMLFLDMTYDYSTHTMYAISYDENTYAAQLLTVNLETGETTYVNDQVGDGSKLAALACSQDGQLYTINVDYQELGTLNKTTGSYTQGAYLNANPGGSSYNSMEFDHETNTLYWVTDGEWYAIDTEAGAEKIGWLGLNAQVAGLCIPFGTSADGAPAAVSDLKVTAGAEGALSASLSWTNPSLNNAGEALTSLTRVEVYRGETLVHTVNNPAIGGAEVWEDTGMSAGKVIYRLSAVNDEGESSQTANPVFIGRDVPAAPAAVTAAVTAAVAVTLTWTAPAAGLNGGWIDAPTLRYTITRLPDNVVLEQAFTGSEYTDTSIAHRGVYTYRIQASTAEGEGGVATTEKVVAGAALALPYSCTFTQADDLLLWTVVDANEDGYTWKPETMPPSVRYYYNEDGETGGDDWLISSPFRLEAGRMYRVRFQMKSQGEDHPEEVDVRLGRGSAVADQSILLKACVVTVADFETYNLMLPADLESGEYHLSFYCHSAPDLYDVNIKGLILEEVSEGSIAGQVTDGTRPVEGGSVTVTGTDRTALTDAEGRYELAEMPSGSYTLRFFKEGYRAEERADVAVAFGEKTEVNVTLTALPVYALSGQVLNGQGKPVEKARITLDGYNRQYTETAADGTFAFSAVYQSDGYTLSVERYGLQSDTRTVDVKDADLTLDPIVLQDKVLPPQRVMAEVQDEQAVIAWQEPWDVRTFRHDNGLHGGRIGATGDTHKSLYGSVYRTPATLTAMTWYTENYLLSHHAVNIFVLDLDNEGQPTSTVLYSQMDVPNTDNEWTVFEFPEPIEAPRGYMLALSYEGHVGLGLDTEDADPAYPFAEDTHCFSKDYTTGQFEYLEEHQIRRSCMIRGVGILRGEDALPPASTDRRYTVWRLHDGQTEQPELWQLLTAEPIDALRYTDADWKSQSQGMYRYAVKTVYAGGAQSDAALSPAVAKDMLTEVVLRVNTDTPQNEAGGAAVTLTDHAGHTYCGTLDAQGQTTFTGVWKARYDLTVTKRGFKPCLMTGVDFTTENRYEKTDCLLEEYVVPPFNLEVVQTERDDERIFNWNVADFLFDDFEGHADFTIDSPGTLGWTYIDADGAETYGIDDVKYANATDPKAYIIFNPSATDPNIAVPNAGIRAHSGEKYLSAFPAYQVENNDFFISPALSFHTDFTFSFYAKSFTDDPRAERMNVGYSTSGRTPDDFTWMNGGTPIEVPEGEWKQYRYTIPAEARYVAINCVSENAFIFMVDDVFVGREVPDDIDLDNMKPDLTYEVYLDGKKVYTGTACTYSFTALQPGVHTAGVKAVYASAVTSLVELEFEVEAGSGLDCTQTARRVLYPNPVKDCFTVTGTYDYLTIHDLSGKPLVRHAARPQISIHDLADGIYMVRVVSGGQYETMKMVISR